MSANPESDGAVTRPATPERWDDVVTVMGTRGDPASCWCQYFRLRGQDWRSASAGANREALHVQIAEAAAPPPGVLAYLDGEPVGWCAVAPKGGYPRLTASRVGGPAEDGVWSVTCFVVRPGWRRRGVAAALLSGAVELARSNGAAVVEGYPVDPKARERVSSAELYHGPLSVFLAAGFREVRRPSAGRAVVRREL